MSQRDFDYSSTGNCSRIISHVFYTDVLSEIVCVLRRGSNLKEIGLNLRGSFGFPGASNVCSVVLQNKGPPPIFSLWGCH